VTPPALSPTPRSRFHRVALVLSLVGLLAVVALGVAAAILDGRSGSPVTRPALASPRPEATGPASATSAAVTPPVVPGDWQRIEVDGASYAVPPGWRPRPADERSAYEEQGRLIAAGRGSTQSWANDCRTDFAPVPVAWAILADPVVATNPGGVAEASAAAWARGYAADPSGTPRHAGTARLLALADGGTAMAASLTVDLTGSANPCDGDAAELTAVAMQRGDRVVTLVVARYLEVEGAPSDATYAAVLASLRQIAP
jgi:hypothetical protein